MTQQLRGGKKRLELERAGMVFGRKWKLRWILTTLEKQKGPGLTFSSRKRRKLSSVLGQVPQKERMKYRF